MSLLPMSHVGDVPARISLNIIQGDSDNDEQPGNSPKRIKLEKSDIDPQMSLKQIMLSVHQAISLRLDTLERRFDSLESKVESRLDKITYLNRALEERLEQLCDKLNAKEDAECSPNNNKNTVIVGLPSGSRTSGTGSNGTNQNTLDGPVQNLGPNVTLITLNSEEDYPAGSWLGDEHNPETRVRVPVSPSDLLHIHSNCRSPEKMALTLLDYLFDRETQAISNLSGTGKHGKRQLDPLMIYGIRCHLFKRFNVSESDWHRIKLNIDSKCRTAFRRKMKGLPLTVKGFRGMPGNRASMQMNLDFDGTGSDDDSMHHHGTDGELHITGDHVDLSGASATEVTGLTQFIQHGSSGEIQVLQATPEQLAQIQHTHNIQVLHSDQVLGLTQGGDLDGYQVAVSMQGNNDGTLQIIGESGETIHITDSTVDDDDAGKAIFVQTEDIQ